MPRLAKSSKAGSRRARRVAPGAERHTLVRTAGIDLTGLMPAGRGLLIPRLDGLTLEHQSYQGERWAARLAFTLLEAGIADAGDWTAANRNPFDFIKRGLEGWLLRHDAQTIREQFSLDVVLSTNLERYLAADDQSQDISRTFLTLEPDSAGYVILGPTLRLLENTHLRLPATFLHLFIDALNRWIRVYDFCCRQQKSYFVAIPVMWRSENDSNVRVASVGPNAT